MKVIKENTLAVLIDFQERLFPHMQNQDALKQNTVRLIRGLQALQVPLIVTQQYTKGLGETISDFCNTIGDFDPVEKISFSCCGNGDFMDQLEWQNKKFVIIAGIEAHVCVLQTVLDLLSGEYVPVVAADCISSRKAYDKEVAIERMRDEGAIITTYESILFELVEAAGTDVFKAISKIVK